VKDYKAAYNVLMDYWDYLPEEEKHIIDDKLNRIFNGSTRPPRNCIKDALKRLRDDCGFGIPDKEYMWKKDPIIIKAMQEELNK